MAICNSNLFCIILFMTNNIAFALAGIKIITNAGGINTGSCVNALKEACSKQGVDLKIAAVCGDNLMPKLDELQDSGGIKEMSTGMELPMLTHSMTAYYGAGPIVKALQGLDYVLS